MANFWEADPIVSPAEADHPPLAPIASTGGAGNFWENDPLAEDDEPDGTQLPARDRYEAALERVRLLQAPDMSPAEFQKMFTEGQDTLIPGMKNAGRFAPYDATDMSQHGLMFGLTDEIEAGMGALGAGFNKLIGGQGPEMGDVWNARLELEQARRDYGRELTGAWGSVAEIAGGLGAGGMSASGAQAMGSQAPGIWNTVKGWTGAGVSGAAYGFGSADGGLAERAAGAGVGAATGAIVGAAAPIAARAVGKVLAAPGNVARSIGAGRVANAAVAGAPTAAAIKATSKAGFRSAEKTGAVVDGNALNLLNHDIGQQLADSGMLLPNGRLVAGFPKINGAMNALCQYTGSGSLTVKQAQILRKTFANVAKSNDGGEASVGRMMVDQLDDFFENLPTQAFSTNGSAGADAVRHWGQARKDWARFKRTDTIEKAIRDAEYAKGGFAEGLRSQFVSILKSERKSRGFSAVELAAMDRYAKGGTLQDFLHNVGSGGSIPASMFGFVTGGPIGAAAATVGKVTAGKFARGGLDRGARKAADYVRAEVALPNGLPPPMARYAGPVVDGSFRRLAVNASNPGLETVRDALLVRMGYPVGSVR